MIIETRRLQFTELNLTDVNTLADIAKDMAWNDTVNILLRTDLTSQNFKECGKPLSAFVQNCAGTGKVSEQRGIGGTV